jgi:hypothetical protein
MTKRRREKALISKIRSKKGEITTNISELQGIIRDYFENLYIQINRKILKKWTNF